MPADQATLQARLDALKTALANDKSEVSYAGRTVRYRSIAELRGAIKDVEFDLAALGGSKVLRTYKFRSHKDL